MKASRGNQIMILKNVLSTLLIVEITIIILWKIAGKLKLAGRNRVRETDLRLTYKRYKELYPDSMISYSEYKKLQAQNAFKKAVSSMEIKRMVR